MAGVELKDYSDVPMEEIIRELEEKIAYMEQHPEEFDPNELIEHKNILHSFLHPIEHEVRHTDPDSLKKPEYRKGGLFMTEDFLEKCRMFEEYIQNYGYNPSELSRKDYIFLKREYMKEIHNIDWYPEEEMFLPEARVII